MSELKEPETKRKPNSGQFKKGQSGNPKGRSPGFKGMAKYIRSQTNDGEELADFALMVFRNADKTYTHVHQWDALKWLADRGFGKPVQAIDLNTVDNGKSLPDIPDVSDLDPKKLAELDALVGTILAGKPEA